MLFTPSGVFNREKMLRYTGQQFMFYANDKLSTKTPLDLRTGITIASFLKKYFDDNPGYLVVFNCFDDDGKGEKRQKKFISWYNSFFDSEKYDLVQIEYKKRTQFVGYLSTHPLRELIIQYLSVLAPSAPPSHEMADDEGINIYTT